MFFLISIAFGWSPVDALPTLSTDTYEVCTPAVLDVMPVEVVFRERVFVEARDCPADDPCCAVGGFAWWEPEDEPFMTLLQAPGCPSDECGECGFTLTAVGLRERVCDDGRARLVFRPRFTVTTPTKLVPQAFPDHVAWVLFPGMPEFNVAPPPVAPEPAVFAVHELEIPDARDAEEAVAGSGAEHSL